MKVRTIVCRLNIGTPFRSMVKSTRYRKTRYTARTLLNAPTLEGERLYCTVLCKVEPSPSYLHNASVQPLKDFK